MSPTQTSGLVLKFLAEPPDLSLLSDAAAWTLIRENAGPAGVAALVADIARPHLPQAEQQWCQRVLTRSWAKYEQNLHHLNSILGTLEREGIQALALKGPALAQRYYNPPFVRKPSVDIDLGVRESDLERACAAFAREGYILETSLRRTRATSYHVMLLHPVRQRIELHFRLSSGPTGIAVDPFFSRAVRWELPGGRLTWVLSPPDELFYLVLHLVGDRFALLFHTYEVRRIWAANSVETRREAVQRGIEHHCVSALKMADVACRSLWNEELLPPDMPFMKTWLDRRLNEDLYKAFAGWWRPDNPLSLANRLRGRWLDFQLTDRPLDALIMARHMALTSWFRLREGGWRTLKISRFATPRDQRCA